MKNSLWIAALVACVTTITASAAINVAAGDSIQDAIDAAVAGDTINVAAGTYVENLVVSTDNLTLVGPNAGIAGDDVRGAEAAIKGYVRVQADSLTVDGMAFIDGGDVPSGDDSALYFVGGGTGHAVRNSLFTRDGLAPSGFDQYRGIITEAGGITNSVIENNLFTGWHTGVYVQNCDGVVVQNNKMEGNAVGMSSDGAINVTVKGNQFLDNGYEGVGVGPGTVVLLIEDNTFLGNPDGVANWGGTQLSATPNWWGDIDPTDDIHGDVVVFPCYADDSMTSVYPPVPVVTDGWHAFVIRENSTEGAPYIIGNSNYGVDAVEIATFASNQKAGLGTDLVSGAKVSQIATLHIDRLDDVANSGSLWGPYFNIWVTDGNGNYAVLANEPSDGEWAGSRWDVPSWDFLKTKRCKVYEVTGSTSGQPGTSWVADYTGKSSGLVFEDVAGLTIEAPSAAYIAAGNGVGSGAPDVLGTNEAYGFNWIFGDTLSNYVTGTGEGFVVVNYSATASYPVMNTTQGTGHQTIQAAIDAANAGDTLVVSSGTYAMDSQIVINKDITLKGEGKDATVLVPTYNTTTSRYSTSSALILIPNGVDVTIEDLAIDGMGKVVGQAIQARGDSLALRGCDISNIVGNQWTGCAVRLLTGTNVVENSTFANIQRIGIHVRGAVESVEPTATISGCTYVGKGDGDFLDYGIEIGGGGDATIDGNTITDCRGIATSADQSTSAAILATDYYGTFTTGVVINNTLSASYAGIHVGYADTDVTELEAHNNNITGNEHGVINVGVVEVDADNNWWGAADGPSGEGPGSGDTVSVNVSFAPWLAVPAIDDLLILLATDASLYIKPTETATVDMDVFNLSQPVSGCQAALKFSSTYFGTTGSIVAAGGGVWDQMIYTMTMGNGDLDVAVGVSLTATGGTTADATIAQLTLTPTGTEGTTTVTFRAAAEDYMETVFATPNFDALYPTTMDSQTIVIDGTAPLAFDAVVDAACTTGNVTVTFATTDALAGIDYYELIVDGNSEGVATSPAELMLEEGDHTIQVKAFDKAGNVTDSSVANVSVDASGPAIASVTATQAGADVLCPAVATQGTVDIYVTVADSGCSALVQPTVAVAGMTVTFKDVVGSVYHYAVSVSETTENGSHTITVTAVDGLGNETVDTDSAICVDKNQVDGTVSMATLSDDAYSFNRDVVFVATDASGTALKSWTQTLSFTNAAGTATANYSLLEVPGTMAGLSAKATLTLRTKEAAAVDTNGQAVVDIAVVGGDLNGSNNVNIIDYSILKANWMDFGAVAPADINGDGQVQTEDYSLLKDAWFTSGDAE